MVIKNLLNQKLLFFALALLFSQHQLFAQGHSENNWYFGNANLGIVFGKGEEDEPEFVNANRSNPATYGMNASAVATDPVTGKMLFYTNGITVFDATHRVMTNGNGLLGDSGRDKSVTILPVKDHRYKYYILTLSSGGSLTYSVVDMELQGNGNGASNPLNFPLGEVTATKNQPVAGLPDPVHAIKLINVGRDNHILITQDAGTREIRSFRINMDAAGTDANGDPLPFQPEDLVVDLLDQFQLPSNYTVRNLSYGAGSRKIAFTAMEPGRNIRVVDFTPSNGTFSNDSALTNSGRINEVIYDVEWSMDGSKLYFTRYQDGANPATGDLFRFDYSINGSSFRRILENPVAASLGLKRGPDGKIYYLYQETSGGSYQIGRINIPSHHIDSIGYETPVFANQNFLARQFPEVSPAANVNSEGDFTWYPENEMTPDQVCQNAEIHFIPNVNPPADSLHWSFGDGNESTEYAPRHTFEEPGQYMVTATAFLNGQSQQLTPRTITVMQFELEVNAQDTTACEFPILYDKLQIEGDQPYEIEWSIPGASGEQVTIEEPGNYWVVVRQGGCETYAAFTARLYNDDVQIANVWYFGNGAGLDFNEDDTRSGSPPYPLTDGVMNAPEGTSTMSDRNGDLMFYTDGQTVWNKNHQPMLNGDNIGGSPASTQSALIVPFPNDETMFYIFTTEAVGNASTYALKYSIVDMKQQYNPSSGFLGEVVEKDQVLFSRSTERITASGLQGGGDVWLVAHEYGTNTFRSYLISERGISNPVLSSAGRIHSEFNTGEGQGYMKLSGNLQRLAVAIQPNIVEIFDFVDSTGRVHNPVTIQVDGTQVYGLEFSANASKLFVSTTQSGIFEYYIGRDDDDDNGNGSNGSDYEFLGVLPGSDAVSGNIGALQVAPNGQIMVAIEGAGHLGAISVNSDRDQQSAFNEQAVDLGGRTSRLGLPNFIQSLMEPPTEPSMDVEQACVNNEVIFSGTGTSDIDEFLWAIYRIDGANRTQISMENPTEQETTHTFTQPGQYEITLRVYNECGYDTLMTQNIEVYPTPDLSGLPGSLSLCDGGRDVGHELPEGDGYTYLWSGGENPTERINTITQQGTYTVTVTNANGCSEEAEIFIGPPFEGLDLGEDRYVCRDENLRLDAGVNADLFEWYVDDVLTQTDGRRTFQPNTATPGTYTVRVRVQDPIDPTCWVSDEIEVTVSGFDLSYTSVDSDQCDDTQASGEIHLTLDPSFTDGDYSIVWMSPNGELTQFANQLSATGLSGGTYSVTVTDNISGCSETENNIGINEPVSFEFESVTNNPDCGGGTIEVWLDVNIDGNWRVLNQNNVEMDAGTLTNARNFTANYTLDADGMHTFTIEVTSNDDCTGTYNVDVERSPTAQADIEPTVMGCGTVSLYDAVHIIHPTQEVEVVFFYDEAGTEPIASRGVNVNAVTPDDIAQHGNVFWAIARRNETDGTYTTDWCPAPAVRVEATVLVEPVVTITVNDNAICDGTVILTAELQEPQNANNNNFSFRWSNGAVTRSITVTNSGTYSVTARYNIYPACISEAASETVDVPEPLELELVATPACDDGSDVLITAETNMAGLQYRWARGNNVIPGATQASYSIQQVNGDNGNGRYTLTVTHSSGCEVSRSITIARTPIRRGNLNAREEICIDENEFVILNPGNFSSYEWTLPNGTTSQAPSLTVDMVGTYQVRLGAAGCYDERQIVVEEVCEARVYAPNAFRPGSNNEENRAFRVASNNYVADFSVFIYNRWGELIYQSTNLDFAWDGTYKGREAPAGTYAYVIRFRTANMPDAPEKRLRGGVLLIR